MKILNILFLLELNSEWYDHFCKGALPVIGNTTFVKVHIYPLKLSAARCFRLSNDVPCDVACFSLYNKD